MKFKFPENSVWFYGNNNYKVFVPYDLVKSFETFAKKNKIAIKFTGSYNYINKNKKLKDRNNGIQRDGKDYIIKRENKDLIISYLKKAYKEIN